MSTIRFTSKLPQARKIILDAAKQGAVTGMQMVLDRSQEIVPLDRTPLQKSGKLDYDNTNFVVHYGSNMSEEYAVLQHENMQFRHAPGRQAKYLEQPFRELTPRILEEIEKSITKVC
jgi:hypothetical protein